ncbi:MAG: orotidine-5'-phosphate decarboxylase [Candidatus Absconditabacteria bacterium]|nr:orotidine-5'-phosphate decarboxylase [Candidatus Absconditabacteria bacterium]
MNYDQLFQQIKKKKSFLCIGLDTDIEKIPAYILKNNIDMPLSDFNKAIIDATVKHTVAYKLNTAFYESQGWNGWMQLDMTVKYIKSHYPDILVIVDAKRSDIGNTCNQYAKAFFELMDADAVTVAPYMGKDSVSPFLKYKDKWTIILALTSNDSSSDLQTLHIEENGLLVFDHILSLATNEWGAESDNSMFVVGATKAESLVLIREIVSDHFLLIPGVGTQGGSLEDVAKYGITRKCGLIINNSRAIIYASNNNDFAEAAAKKARETQKEMEEILQKYGII